MLKKKHVLEKKKNNNNLDDFNILIVIIMTTKGAYPPARETSREIANLIERKNPHSLVFWQEIITLTCPISRGE